MRYRTLLWFSTLLLASSIGLAAGGAKISPEELLAGTALDLGSDLPAIVSPDDVMALSDEMREFLRTHVSDGAAANVILHQLGHAVFGQDSFGLEYDETTRTAAETFAARQGNCLSFTFMFVVLARGVGIDARFQEVEIPPEWTFANDTYILNRHINIFIDLGVRKERVVDFDILDLQADYEMHVVSDARALAHFYNNVGAELMQFGEMAAAFHAFRTAIAEKDRSFAPAWNNLGTLYSRTGLPYYAEAAYLHALKIDRSNLIAMSNLTTLYDRRGDQKRAERYRNKVNSHRNRNPYYRYQMARVAYTVGDYDLAIDHLRYAMRKRKDEDRFCALLGLVYLEIGDEDKFLRLMTRAEELAETDALKSFYASKIASVTSASH